jgi:hypothetical protein
LEKTLDLYTLVPEAFRSEAEEAGLPLEELICGGPEEITEHILFFANLGFAEVRCDVWPRTPTAIEAMTSVVEMVHAS